MWMCASVGGAVTQQVGTLTQGVWASHTLRQSCYVGEEGVQAAGCSATCKQLQRQARLLLHSSSGRWAARNSATE